MEDAMRKSNVLIDMNYFRNVLFVILLLPIFDIALADDGKTFNYYEILGVKRSANWQEIARAYRRLALKIHPDRDPSPHAEEEFSKIALAKEVLTDPRQRAAYDYYLDTGRQPGKYSYQYYKDAAYWTAAYSTPTHGTFTVLIWLLFLISGCQYGYGWYAYYRIMQQVKKSENFRKRLKHSHIRIAGPRIRETFGVKLLWHWPLSFLRFLYNISIAPIMYMAKWPRIASRVSTGYHHDIPAHCPMPPTTGDTHENHSSHESPRKHKHSHLKQRKPHTH